jgi:hypothetical protein
MASIEDELNNLDSNVVNNLWLLEPTATDIVVDPTTGPEDDSTITMRTLGVTFESINKNIASYPNQVAMYTENGKDMIRKTYYLEDSMIITMLTEMSVDGNLIISTLTGDTTLDYDIKKITTINNNLINTVYEKIIEVV